MTFLTRTIKTIHCRFGNGDPLVSKDMEAVLVKPINSKCSVAVVCLG